MASKRALRVQQGKRTSSPQVANESAVHAAAIAKGLDAHRRGDLASARSYYSAVLDADPRHFDALHLLGVVATQLGQPQVAVRLLELAIGRRPLAPEPYNHLALALDALGRRDDAEVALRHALTIATDYVDALRNLARYRADRGERTEAIVLLRRALRTAPDNAAVLNNLGLLLLDAGDAAEALALLKRAAARSPRDPHLLANLGRAALEADQTEPGIDACERALVLDANHVSALVTLAALERARGRFDVAERCCRRVIELDPNSRDARINLATVLGEMGALDAAQSELDHLIVANGCDAQARTSRGVVRLARGDLRGWEDFEWRWRTKASALPSPSAAPVWSGESLSGRSIRVWPEGGIGDQIVMASMLPDLLVQAARVEIDCEPRLAPIFARSFPSAVIRDNGTQRAHDRSATDYQSSLTDLARWLRPRMECFTELAAYLTPDAARVEQWRAWLASFGDGLKVGFSWRSHNQRGERRLAGSTLDAWQRVFAVPGAQFVCLQYDDCSAELAALARRSCVQVHVPPGLDQRNDLEGVIALMHALDLVISAATTVSVLAAAAGTPTRQLTRGIDAQSLGCRHSPWQSRLLRYVCPWNTPWLAVLDAIARDLELRVQEGVGAAR